MDRIDAPGADDAFLSQRTRAATWHRAPTCRYVRYSACAAQTCRALLWTRPGSTESPLLSRQRARPATPDAGPRRSMPVAEESSRPRRSPPLADHRSVVFERSLNASTSSRAHGIAVPVSPGESAARRSSRGALGASATALSPLHGSCQPLRMGAGGTVRRTPTDGRRPPALSCPVAASATTVTRTPGCR